jgi:DNA-binding NarL/FixJ family response regulator
LGNLRGGRRRPRNRRQSITAATGFDHFGFQNAFSDGIQAASEICTTMPSVPIIMYTLYKTNELEVAAKMIGIRSVVAKKDGIRSLLSAIDAELPH